MTPTATSDRREPDGAHPAPSPAAGDVRLYRVRRGVRAALGLGIVASLAANVLHADPNTVAQVISAWSPLALAICVEMVSRVPRWSAWLSAVRVAGTASVAGIAAWVAYHHMVAVAQRYGETPSAAHLLPLSVDGMIVVASVCLVEIGRHVAATERDAPNRPPLAAAKVPEPAGSPASTSAQPVPAPRTGTPTRRRTGTPATARTGRRTDTDLIAALADVQREADGTVPVRRAAAALGCGPDRARRLLAREGLLRLRTADAPPPQTAVLTAV